MCFLVSQVPRKAKAGGGGKSRNPKVKSKAIVEDFDTDDSSDNDKPGVDKTAGPVEVNPSSTKKKKKDKKEKADKKEKKKEKKAKKEKAKERSPSVEAEEGEITDKVDKEKPEKKSKVWTIIKWLVRTMAPCLWPPYPVSAQGNKNGNKTDNFLFRKRKRAARTRLLLLSTSLLGRLWLWVRTD